MPSAAYFFGAAKMAKKDLEMCVYGALVTFLEMPNTYRRRWKDQTDRDVDTLYLTIYMQTFLQSDHIRHGHDLFMPLTAFVRVFNAWLDRTTVPLKHKPNFKTVSAAMGLMGGIELETFRTRTYDGVPRRRAHWVLGIDVAMEARS
jgi:hypothetical protein